MLQWAFAIVTVAAFLAFFMLDVIVGVAYFLLFFLFLFSCFFLFSFLVFCFFFVCLFFVCFFCFFVFVTLYICSDQFLTSSTRLLLEQGKRNRRTTRQTDIERPSKFRNVCRPLTMNRQTQA